MSTGNCVITAKRGHYILGWFKNSQTSPNASGFVEPSHILLICIYHSILPIIISILYISQDTDLTWNGQWPQFTPCFQNTILLWIPCGFLWIAAPFYARQIRHHATKPRPFSALYAGKQVRIILCLSRRFDVYMVYMPSTFSFAY